MMHLASRVFVFCKPILAILLQRKCLIDRMHLVVVFCKPIVAMLLRRKDQTHQFHAPQKKFMLTEVRFGNAEPTFENAHRSTFQGCEYRIWATKRCNVLILQSLCSPNADIGWPKERLGTHFRSTFRRNVAQSSTHPQTFLRCSQTQILEARTTTCVCVFERTFSESKTHSEMLVRPSKIFVWDG